MFETRLFLKKNPAWLCASMQMRCGGVNPLLPMSHWYCHWCSDKTQSEYRPWGGKQESECGWSIVSLWNLSHIKNSPIREKNRLGFINSAIVYSYYPTGRVSEIWEDWMLNPAQCSLTLPLSFQGWDWALTILMLQKHIIEKKIITNPQMLGYGAIY